MGNTVVVKPAPQDPLSVLKMAEALEEAGLPAGVVNVISGQAVGVGEALVDSPDVDMVSFTGSTQVGRAIGAVAGGSMKRVLMELGGKGAGDRVRRRRRQGGDRRDRHDVSASTRARSAPRRPGSTRIAAVLRPGGRRA